MSVSKCFSVHRSYIITNGQELRNTNENGKKVILNFFIEMQLCTVHLQKLARFRYHRAGRIFVPQKPYFSYQMYICPCKIFKLSTKSDTFRKNKLKIDILMLYFFSLDFRFESYWHWLEWKY